MSDDPSPDLNSLPFRVGTAPVNWNNFDLEGWRDVVPFPHILDEMRAAGYDGTEWDQSFGSDVATLAREARSRGLSYVGAYRWLDFLNDDQFALDLAVVAPFLGTLREIGVRHLIVADSLRPDRVALAGSVPDDGSASLDGAGYDRIVANLYRLHEVAARHDLAVHYHNHVGSYIETPTELLELADRLDLARVDLCFDTGHYAFGGGDPLAFLRQNVRSIGYVHLKDVDANVLTEAKANRWSFLEALRHVIFSPLGDGSANVPEIVRFLVREGYAGYIIVEQDTCSGDATETARANREVVERSGLAALQDRSANA